MNDTVINYIRVIRKEKGMTSDKLSELTGLSPTYITRLENGKRNLSVKNMMLFASALGVQPHTLITKSSADPKVTEIPVLSWVQAGAFAEAIPEFDLSDCERVPVVNASNPHLFALKVRGTSMNAIAPDNSHIVVNPLDKDLIDGCYYVVILEDETTFKRYNAEPARLEPVSYDPVHKTIFPKNGTEVVGRVIKVVNDL